MILKHHYCIVVRLCGEHKFQSSHLKNISSNQSAFFIVNGVDFTEFSSKNRFSFFRQFNAYKKLRCFPLIWRNILKCVSKIYCLRKNISSNQLFGKIVVFTKFLLKNAVCLRVNFQYFFVFFFIYQTLKQLYIFLTLIF